MARSSVIHRSTQHLETGKGKVIDSTGIDRVVASKISTALKASPSFSSTFGGGREQSGFMWSNLFNPEVPNPTVTPDNWQPDSSNDRQTRSPSPANDRKSRSPSPANDRKSRSPSPANTTWTFGGLRDQAVSIWCKLFNSEVPNPTVSPDNVQPASPNERKTRSPSPANDCKTRSPSPANDCKTRSPSPVNDRKTLSPSNYHIPWYAGGMTAGSMPTTAPPTASTFKTPWYAGGMTDETRSTPTHLSALSTYQPAWFSGEDLTVFGMRVHARSPPCRSRPAPPTKKTSSHVNINNSFASSSNHYISGAFSPVVLHKTPSPSRMQCNFDRNLQCQDKAIPTRRDVSLVNPSQGFSHVQSSCVWSKVCPNQRPYSAMECSSANSFTSTPLNHPNQWRAEEIESTHVRANSNKKGPGPDRYAAIIKRTSVPAATRSFYLDISRPRAQDSPPSNVKVLPPETVRRKETRCSGRTPRVLSSLTDRVLAITLFLGILLFLAQPPSNVHKVPETVRRQETRCSGRIPRVLSSLTNAGSHFLLFLAITLFLAILLFLAQPPPNVYKLPETVRRKETRCSGRIPRVLSSLTDAGSHYLLFLAIALLLAILLCLAYYSCLRLCF